MTVTWGQHTAAGRSPCPDAARGDMPMSTPDVVADAASKQASSEARKGDTGMALEVKELSCGYASHVVLSDVSLSLRAGNILVLLGPNGVGKTTLFKTILGFLPSFAGSVLIDGEDVGTWTRRRFARTVAYVPQHHETSFGFSVYEMVLMGRTPSIEGLGSPSGEDAQIVDAVLEELGLAALADRDCTTLSGGELQMVLVARALAQQPGLLVMDEPCANLDLGNQVLLLRCIADLAKRGLAVMVTSHDPNHALLLESEVACISRSGTVVKGRAVDMLTPEALESLYGVEVGVGVLSDSGGNRVTACAPTFGSGDSVSAATRGPQQTTQVNDLKHPKGSE